MIEGLRKNLRHTSEYKSRTKKKADSIWREIETMGKHLKPVKQEQTIFGPIMRDFPNYPLWMLCRDLL
jgi:hypothetical protein